MTTHQSATINGLLAENIGKNGLVRDANSRAQDAEMKASQLQREAQFQEIRASRVPALEAQLEYQKKQTEYYKNLLSKPMQEIARQNDDFKATYDKQQELLTDWIVSQKAYKETAMQLGIQVGKTPDQIKEMAKQNITAVLENKTKHDNNIEAIPSVKTQAEKILEIRKSKGLC